MKFPNSHLPTLPDGGAERLGIGSWEPGVAAVVRSIA